MKNKEKNISYLQEEKDEGREEQGSNAALKKKKLKKAVIIITCVFVALALIAYGAPLLIDYFGEDETSYQPWRFYEADYSKNIFDDAEYMSCGRSIKYRDENTEYVLTKENSAEISPSAAFFYNYINCIINGDYESYPSYFTEDYRKDENAHLPEQFTMQGLYDIHIDLHQPASTVKLDGGEVFREIYEVSYRIFQNNGTFRDDILPEETRTLVFELYIGTNGDAYINSIGYRTDVNE